MLDFTLHVIELADIRTSLPRNLALAADMQVKELAPRMRHAPGLSDATDKSGFITGVIVANQTALPFAQECSGMFSRPGLAEVIDHRFQILECSGRIGPKISPVCFLVSGFEHGHRSLIGVQDRVAEH